MGALSGPSDPSFALAAIHSLLSGFSAQQLREAAAALPLVQLSHYRASYLAAMAESAGDAQRLKAPAWTRPVEPLAAPIFGAALAALRPYLLTHSPAPLRRRDIFVDSSIGAPVSVSRGTSLQRRHPPLVRAAECRTAPD